MSFEKCPVCATPVSALDAKCPKCKAILIKEKTESHVNKELDASNTKQQELYEEVKKQNGKQTASKPTFGDAIRTCFSKYATFHGRARRSEFWYWVLFNGVVSVFLGILPLFGRILCGIWSLVVLLPSLAVLVRRFHDIGKSGSSLLGYLLAVSIFIIFIVVISVEDTEWFRIGVVPCLFVLIPISKLIVNLVRDSESKDNRYGKASEFLDKINVSSTQKKETSVNKDSTDVDNNCTTTIIHSSSTNLIDEDNTTIDSKNTQQKILQSIYEELKKQNEKQEVPSSPTLGSSIRTCFSKYATFHGRARRSEFWYWVLFNLIISIGLGIISLVGGAWVSLLWNLIVFLPNLAVWVRRLHDIGKSGWSIVFDICFLVFSFYVVWDFFIMEPLFGTTKLPRPILPIVLIGSPVIILSMFINLVTNSERCENRYGKSPKYPNKN